MTKALEESGQAIDHRDSINKTALFTKLTAKTFLSRSFVYLRMIIGTLSMKDYRKAKKQLDVSVGDSVRIIRELQELSQNELATLSGIPQSTLSAIENNRVNLGVERAKVLAKALRCHPAVLVFPGWDLESAA